MIRFSRALPLLLLAACAPSAEEPAAPVITRAGDLSVETRDLRTEATFAAVGLSGEGDRRDGASTWDGTFSEGETRPGRDGVLREFRITIANRSSIAREFHARIDYLDSEGDVVKRRTLENLVAPPFTEVSWSGSVVLPRPGNNQALARVLPLAEPFDPPLPR
ncbi:MAG TPA: hypothetical protein VGE86_09240 [Thermoanaerobaculia bacterium]